MAESRFSINLQGMKKMLVILAVLCVHHALAQTDTAGSSRGAGGASSDLGANPASGMVLHVWEAEDKDGKMQIFNVRDTFYGKMIYSGRVFEADGKTYKKDIHNPDTALRSRSLEGYTLVSGLTFKDGKWVNGKIYDFDSGNYYDVNLEIKDGVLYMRAYKGKPIFGKTIKWNLVQ